MVEHYAKQGKVTVIGGDRDRRAVLADSCLAVEGTVRAEVLAANALLLDAICAGDWGAYAAMADPAMTCFEPEAAELGLVEGLEFHRGAFEEGARARAEAVLHGRAPQWSASTMMEAQVRLLGPRHALVTYVRCTSPLQAAQGAPVARVAETRVWRLAEEGRWRLTHVHRSPMPALEAK